MRFIKLNEDWNAEPNAPEPRIEITGARLRLSFYMNPYLYPQFSENDIGVLEFTRCRQYRMGAPNDEGFYNHGQSRYQQYGVEWGEFYLVDNSDWKANFPDAKIIDGDIPVNPLNHYLFYFRDETFEVVAEKYTFHVVKA
jgi:hypothetical protein